MITIVQVILIATAIVVVLTTLGSRRTHTGRAWKKIGLLLLAIAMVVAVVFPNTTNTIAAIVGVGRGADLLLYATVAAFILYALNNYLHQQDQRDSIYRLARKVAILEAMERYKINRK